MHSQDDETDWSSIRKYVSLLAVIILGTGGYTIWKNTRSEKAPVEKVAATKPKGNPVDVKKNKRASVKSTLKLTIPEGSVTADSTRHYIQDWLEKAFQSEGLTPEPAHLPKERWVPFVKAAIQMECGAPDAPSARAVMDLARDLVPVAHEHPVSAMLVGMIMIRQDGSHALLETAVKALAAQPGMETLAFQAAVGLALSSGEGDTEEIVQKRVTEAIQALRKALDAETGYAKYHDRLCAYLLMSGHVKAFFEAMHEPFWEEVSKTEGVKPWVKKWVEGLHCLQKGWDARGGGYSNTVSDDGQAVFKHESEKARRLLKQAWELKPEDPSPAVALIYSSLSMERSVVLNEMREWFDESLKLQVDVAEAAQHMLWGLRPRWYGSHKKMEDFGLACLETERFDSNLPWVLLQAHRDCASEWDEPNEYFQKLFCYDRLQALFEGAENEPKREAWRSVDRTHAAIASFKCGEYEQAQRWLEKLEFKPNATVIESWGDVDVDLLLGKTAAFAGEQGAKLRQAEKAEANFQAEMASTLYEEALKPETTKLSEASQRYVEKRAALMKLEKDYFKGQAISLLPDAKFSTWTRDGGGFKLTEGVLEHFGREKVQSSTCLVRVGAAFTLEGDLEVTEPGEGVQIWFSHGYPERMDKERWIALRFAFDGKQTLALLSNGMGRPLEHPAIEVEPRFKFKLIGTKSGITLFVNDKPILENVPVPEDFVNERYSQIGFGAATKSEKTRVKIHALTVKS